MSDVDSLPLRAAFPRSVFIVAGICIAIFVVLVSGSILTAMNRLRIEGDIAELMDERRSDYKAIGESLELAKNLLGHYPESMEQWLSVSPQADKLLEEPHGASQPYAVRFDALQSEALVILIFDPGRDLLRMPEEIRERVGAHLSYFPGGEYPFRMITEFERSNRFGALNTAEQQ